MAGAKGGNAQRWIVVRRRFREDYRREARCEGGSYKLY